jgi:predicted lipoprotein with Yx(FWY)xxD motif
MRRILVIAVLAAAVLAPSAISAHGVDRGTVTAHSSRFGSILFDGRGFVLYAFTRDPRGRSVCSGACAKAWPPYLKPKSTLRVGKGLKRALLGTVARRNGRRQVTYAGRPLYYYVGDNGPGVIRCQDVFEYGGRWLVVRSTGSPVR